MLKIKATKKSMKENYRILGSGYCSMQTLLKYEDAIAYSAGSNGWQCDYYDVNNVVISTGYAPLTSKNMNCDYELIREYEKKAKIIDSDYTKDWQDRAEEIEVLLCDLLEDLKIN